MVKRALLTGALALALALPAAAQENIFELAEVWRKVRFEHPWMLRGEIDWDAALVRAVPKAGAAKSEAELAKAIGEMLAELHDPATRVAERAAAKPAGVPAARKDGNVLIVNRFDPAIAPDFEAAGAVVLDLRSGGIPSAPLLRIPGVVREVVPDIPMRSVFHSGYAPQQGTSSGGYYSGFLTTFASGITPRPNAPGVPKRLVFVTSDGSDLPAAAIAMWWNGNAAIVSERPLGPGAGAGTEEIAIGTSHVAHLRTSELAAKGLIADLVGGPDALAKAIELAAAATPFAKRPPPVSGELAARRVLDKPYADMHYPDLGHRMLALIRVWSTIRTFYPYLDLISDWDATFRELIPRFESAKDEKEYAGAVIELLARVEDGHSGAFGHRAANEILGAWTFPAVVRWVEGEYVVVEMRGNVPEGTQLAVGDAIVSVDGEPFADRVRRMWKYRAGANEAARRNSVAATALRGPANSTAKVGVRGADGAIRIVDVPRVAVPAPPKREGAAYRLLEGNVGYADLTRLIPADVDAMFEAFASTKAIVFDMRGYPNGTAWTIAPRINTKKAAHGASFRRVQLPADSDGAYAFLQPLPKSNKPVYQGKTVMLIDDRAISQAEHTGLFFEAANGTTFIGTSSAGTNGDVTNFPIPGGFTVSFTGHDVRHVDGRQLQRIGLVPSVRVEPTIRGIREGKDEVLERAIAYLNDGK